MFHRKEHRELREKKLIFFVFFEFFVVKTEP
jgi:hypothetical protein